MDVKSAVQAAAAQLQQQFVAALAGQIPDAAELARIQWATETIAAGAVLAGNADTREQVAMAKSVLANVAVAHEIDGAAAVNQLITSALNQLVPVIEKVLLTAAIAAV